MLLQDAISIVCGEICLQLGSNLTQATQAVHVVPGKITDSSVTTWLVHDTHMFTLIKHGASTLAYCHGNRTLFYARPEFMLSSTTPDGYSFLTQIAEDRERGARPDAPPATVPRLLIMDLVTPRIEEPGRRYEALRALPFGFPPSCVLQWAGHQQALRRFLQGDLPHQVSGVIALCGPLRIVRELRVEPPVPCFVAPPVPCFVGAARPGEPDARAEDPTATKRARV